MVFAQSAALYSWAAGEFDGPDLLGFFADRMKVHLREQGVRHDLVSSIFALSGEDDLVRLLARVDALKDFVVSDDGVNLLTAYKRAANILTIEEKKDEVNYDAVVDRGLFVEDEETRMAEALEQSLARVGAAIEAEEFVVAMSALSELRVPVDTFFDVVIVNAKDAALRANRLKLLSEIRTTMNKVADFSHIEG
jgi:glycyl-tRNA synthetase beta chain